MARLKQAKNQRESVDTSNDKSSTEFLLFMAINVLLVGISTWQTFVGYKADVAGNVLVALTIALASGILFLALNFGIRERRQNGESHWLLIVMYIIPLGMSFFGNFNAFYSNQTKKNFTKTAIREYQTQLIQTKDEAITAIETNAGINKFERDYNSKLEQLRIEFNRPPAGWGNEAENKWTQLVQFLNNSGGNINASVLGNTSDRTRFNRALANAEAEKENIVNSRKSKAQPTLTAIENKFDPVYQKVDSLVNLPTPVYNVALLDDIIDAENYIRSQASAYLDDQNIFTHDALKPHSVAESATIKHTLQKAFIEKAQPSATFFSLFFSLIIDFAALLYVLVFYRYNKSGGSKRGKSESVGPREI